MNIRNLDHSRLFDVHRWSDHPEVKTFLIDLYVGWDDDPLLVTAFSLNKESRIRQNDLGPVSAPA